MFRIFFPLNIDSLFQHKKCFHLLFILEYSLASICGWKVKKKEVNSWTMIISIFMLIKILHLSKNLTLWIIKTMKSTKIDIQCKYWWNHNKKTKKIELPAKWEFFPLDDLHFICWKAFTQNGNSCQISTFLKSDLKKKVFQYKFQCKNISLLCIITLHTCNLCLDYMQSYFRSVIFSTFFNWKRFRPALNSPDKTMFK